MKWAMLFLFLMLLAQGYSMAVGARYFMERQDHMCVRYGALCARVDSLESFFSTLKLGLDTP